MVFMNKRFINGEKKLNLKVLFINIMALHDKSILERCNFKLSLFSHIFLWLLGIILFVITSASSLETLPFKSNTSALTPAVILLSFVIYIIWYATSHLFADQVFVHTLKNFVTPLASSTTLQVPTCDSLHLMVNIHDWTSAIIDIHTSGG